MEEHSQAMLARPKTTKSTRKESILRDMTADHRNPDSSRRAFDKIFKQVLDAADVVLYFLMHRDPEGTRSREVERQIMAAESGSKRLILVLNKSTWSLHPC